MPNSEFTSPPPEQFVLDRLRFGVTSRVGATMRESAKIHVMEDFITRQLVVALEAEVLAEKLVGGTATASRSEPKTWLDYLKRDVWYTDLAHDRIMRWIAKRWPIQYRKVILTATFDRYALFPEANIALPELGKPVIFEKWSEPRWEVVE